MIAKRTSGALARKVRHAASVRMSAPAVPPRLPQHSLFSASLRAMESTATASLSLPPASIVGWREWLALPDLGVTAIKAKIDSGARSSALHVVWQERFHRNGGPWLRFAVESSGMGSPQVESEAEIVDERNVTDSGGHTTRRPFIRTRVKLGGDLWPIEINLFDRRHMLFPMLLGRTAMIARLLVDPARSFLRGGDLTEAP